MLKLYCFQSYTVQSYTEAQQNPQPEGTLCSGRYIQSMKHRATGKLTPERNPSDQSCCVFVCSGQVVLFAAVTWPSVVSRARLPSRAHLPLAPGQHFSISPSCLVSEETKPKPSACSSSSDTTIHNSATFKQLLHQEHSEHKTKCSAMQVTTASCASWYLLFRLGKCIEPFFLSGFKSKSQLFPGKKLTFLGEISLCLNTSLTEEALCSLTHLLQKISRTSTGKEILCSLNRDCLHF